MAHAYLEDYVLQRYRTMVTARARVEHLEGLFRRVVVGALTADAVRRYQLHRRKLGAGAATTNRETSALSRMFQLAIRRGQLERMPHFRTASEENPPREGFFEHEEYLKVRAHMPAPTKTCWTLPTTPAALLLAATRRESPDPTAVRVDAPANLGAAGAGGLTWQRLTKEYGEEMAQHGRGVRET